MFRSRENLHSLYVLLFLHIAFFFMQLQDSARYVQAFAFDRNLFLSGQVWRIITYQFLTGSFLGSPAIGLFFALLILYIMGAPIEEEFGTPAFIAIFLASTLATAAVPFALGFPLIGSFFLGYSLLFIYADLYPNQTFLLMMILPVKVKWIAWIAVGTLVLGLFGGSGASLSAAVGSGVAYGFYRLMLKGGGKVFRTRPPLRANQGTATPGETGPAKNNLDLFTEIKRVADGGTAPERDALIERLEPGVVAGVNICPPADYKPAAQDLYCVRCEGFNECSIRYLRISADRKKTDSEAAKEKQ